MGLIKLKKVHTKDNVADILTKPLELKSHMRHVNALMGNQEEDATAMIGQEVSFAQRLLEVHRSAGHANFAVIRRLLGEPASRDNPTCTECMVAKMRQGSLPSQAQERSTRVIHRLHMDLAFGKEHIFLVVVDDYSRKTFAKEMKTKSHTLEALRELVTWMENDKAPWTVACIRMDSEPLLKSDEIKDWIKQKGVKPEHSPRYKHALNGVVERTIQTIGNAARAMMLGGSAPEAEFKYAFEHAVFCRNNLPTKANKGATPNEKWTG